MKPVKKKVTKKTKDPIWVHDGGGCSVIGLKFPCDDTYIRKSKNFQEEVTIMSMGGHLGLDEGTKPLPMKVDDIRTLVDGKTSIFGSYSKIAYFKEKDKVTNIDSYLGK